MERTYRRDLSRNYLVIAGSGLSGDEYALKMLIRNPVPDLFLQVSCRMLDGKTQLYYDVTSRQSLTALYANRQIGGVKIRELLTGIDKAVKLCEAYLIDPAFISLEPDDIYLAPGSGLPAFMYLPAKRESIGGEKRPLLSLSEFILKHLDHGDRTAVDLGYDLYSGISSAKAEVFSLPGEILRKNADSRSQRETGRDRAAGAEEEREIRRDLPFDFSTESFDEHKEGEGLQSGPLAVNRKEPEEGNYRGNNKGDNKGKSARKPASKGGKQKAAARRRGRAGKNKRGTNKKGAAKNSKKKKRMIIYGVIIVLLVIVYISAVLVTRMDQTTAGGTAFLMIALTWLVLGSIEKKVNDKSSWDGEISKGEDDELIEKLIREEDIFRTTLERDASGGRSTAEARNMNYDGADPFAGQAGRSDGYRAAAGFHPGNERIPGVGQRQTREWENTAGPEKKREAGRTSEQGTVFLAETGPGSLALVSLSPDKYGDILIETPGAMIGSAPSADFQISSPVVSRLHARIEKEDQGCFIKDLSSLNGTFVNEERLEPNERRQIYDGDKIGFAAISYRLDIK